MNVQSLGKMPTSEALADITVHLLFVFFFVSNRVQSRKAGSRQSCVPEIPIRGSESQNQDNVVYFYVPVPTGIFCTTVARHPNRQIIRLPTLVESSGQTMSSLKDYN